MISKILKRAALLSAETTEAINDLKDDDTQYLAIKKLLRKVGERQVKQVFTPIIGFVLFLNFA